MILSGGDPWSLSDRRLKQSTDALQALPDIRRLRIHTRYPIVLPERIDTACSDWLQGLRLQKVGHGMPTTPSEIDDVGAPGLRQAVVGWSPLLNQSVLLKGVNDNVTALAELSESAIRDARPSLLPPWYWTMCRARAPFRSCPKPGRCNSTRS